jgi:acetoin utilization deacetylase AcuC-like enzyme
VQALADQFCGGRLALVLEGGYSLEGLGQSVVATIDTLEGTPPPPRADQPGPAVQRVITQARTLHGLE